MVGGMVGGRGGARPHHAVSTCPSATVFPKYHYDNSAIKLFPNIATFAISYPKQTLSRLCALGMPETLRLNERANKGTVIR